MGKYYRRATDRFKPFIDKVIDPLALIVGLNAALSVAIYYTHKFIFQPVFFWMWEGRLYSFIERHTWIEFIIKFLFYSSVYGWLNLKVILPAFKRAINRRTTPSWKNHIKTWVILFTGIIVWTYGGVEQDYHRVKWRIINADGFVDTIGAVFNPTHFRTVDNYMSGSKICRIVEHTWAVIGNRSSKTIAQEIERECKRIRRRHIATASSISTDAASLIERGLIDSPAQLIYITRVIYFEGAFDPNAKSLEDIKAGLTGIASVMYNRYLHDKANEKDGRPREFSNKGANLYDIVFHRAPNPYGSITWQFSAIPKNASYFNGKRPLTLSSGKIHTDRALLCYEILIEVLTGKRLDNTKAALFYQNPRCVDRHNRNWKARGLVEVTKINSHHFFRPDHLSENWRNRIGV